MNAARIGNFSSLTVTRRLWRKRPLDRLQQRFVLLFEVLGFKRQPINARWRGHHILAQFEIAERGRQTERPPILAHGFGASSNRSHVSFSSGAVSVGPRDAMSYRRNRLSLRIPWLVEAVAEGPLAIVVLLVLVILLFAAKGGPTQPRRAVCRDRTDVQQRIADLAISVLGCCELHSQKQAQLKVGAFQPQPSGYKN